MKNKSIPHIIWKHYIYFSKPLVMLYHQSYFQEIFFFFFFLFFLVKIILYCLIQFSPCPLIFFPYILFNLPVLTFTSYYSICTTPTFSYFALKKKRFSLFFFFFLFHFHFWWIFKNYIYSFFTYDFFFVIVLKIVASNLHTL